MRTVKSFSLVMFIGIAVAGLSASSARATVLTFAYSATITSSSLGAGQLSASDGMLGGLISGTFEYDVDASKVFDSAHEDRYRSTLSAASIEFASGITATAEGNFLRVLNNFSTSSFDQFVFNAGQGNLAGAAPGFISTLAYTGQELLQVVFQDDTGTAFTSADLPSSFFLDDFGTHNIVFRGNTSSGSDLLTADITSVGLVSVVPLPAALPLFLTGIAGLGLMRRRLQRQTA